jgi:hypothetical protein
LASLGLSQEDRDVVHAMYVEHGVIDMETSAIFDTIPPGNEGIDLSHEGGEYEPVMNKPDPNP